MGMSVRRAGLGWACPSERAKDGHVRPGGLGKGMSPGAARRGGRDFLGGHHEPEGYGDVGAPGADGAAGVVPGHQFAEGIRESALNPVAHHHAGAQGSVGEELPGLGGRCTHPFILGRAGSVKPG